MEMMASNVTATIITGRNQFSQIMDFGGKILTMLSLSFQIQRRKYINDFQNNQAERVRYPVGPYRLSVMTRSASISSTLFLRSLRLALKNATSSSTFNLRMPPAKLRSNIECFVGNHLRGSRNWSPHRGHKRKYSQSMPVTKTPLTDETYLTRINPIIIANFLSIR